MCWKRKQGFWICEHIDACPITTANTYVHASLISLPFWLIVGLKTKSARVKASSQPTASIMAGWAHAHIAILCAYMPWLVSSKIFRLLNPTFMCKRTCATDIRQLYHELSCPIIHMFNNPNINFRSSTWYQSKYLLVVFRLQQSRTPGDHWFKS